jgi:L-seryl-tRNA(Ser) seleniumtransferase
VGAGDDAVGLNARLRALPSVERLAQDLLATGSAGEAADQLVVAVARETVDRRRDELRAGATGSADLLSRAREALHAARAPSLRRVINATGVIVHTNLGRAPLAEEAAEAVARVARGYTNLELDLAGGRRGSRHAHVEGLLCELTGAEAAMTVNNCAGAVLLAAAVLGGRGRSIVVSRGQLIEIGGSFRIPDVVAASGSRLAEVGTANRTRLSDYAAALKDPEVQPIGAIMRAHPSNFRAVGFVEQVEIESLCSLGVAVIDDVGSGVLADDLEALADEPPVSRSVRAGASLVCFSGDKLLGGPQAGLMVGTSEHVGRARRHPLARALRIDKLCLAALEATLALYRDPAQARRRIPVLAMLEVAPAELERRARRLSGALGGTGSAEVVEAVARVGGGALPLLELRGPAVAIDPGPPGADALAAALRSGDPPVVARIAEGRLLLDPRTMSADEVDAAARAVLAALER